MPISLGQSIKWEDKFAAMTTTMKSRETPVDFLSRIDAIVDDLTGLGTVRRDEKAVKTVEYFAVDERSRF